MYGNKTQIEYKGYNLIKTGKQSWRIDKDETKLVGFGRTLNEVKAIVDRKQA